MPAESLESAGTTLIIDDVGQQKVLMWLLVPFLFKELEVGGM